MFKELEVPAKFVIVLCVSLAFLICSVMFLNMITRRSAEDTKLIEDAKTERMLRCIEGGGSWIENLNGECHKQ